MPKVLMKSFAALVGVSLLFPASLMHARIFDLREQAIYTEAFEGFVKAYDVAAKQYKAQGPAAFVETMMSGENQSEQKFMAKTLGSLPPLPKITSDQALLIIDAAEFNAGIHTVEVSNIDDGLLIVDGAPIEFDPTKFDVESIATKIEGALDRSTLKASLMDRFSDAVFPKAYAATKKRNLLVWGLMGAVGAMGVKWVWDAWGRRNGGAGKKDGLRELAESRGLDPTFYDKHGAPKK